MSKSTILQFRKEDFYKTSYLSSDDCAITRALHRAGLTYLHDCGNSIETLYGTIVAITNENTLYVQMREKVMGMYVFAKKQNLMSNNGFVQPIEAEDFEFALPIG